jgi:glycosyltransferase involved in cell wall biosynthesis
MKKILFYTHENPQGYRIQHYFPFLEARGFKVSLITKTEPFADLLDKAASADVVYIQRILMGSFKLYRLRKKARKMVFDFDDAVMYGSGGESSSRWRKFANIIECSDAVTAGNRFLVSEAKKHKLRNVFYIPTVVDTDKYPVKTHEATPCPMVGWIGSKSTLKYVSDLKDVILPLTEAGHIRFKVIADAPPEFSNPGVIFEKWQADREQEGLMSFDVGIMPMRDDVWSRGKCGLKLIQYLASGLPSVSHPEGVAGEIIDNGVNGFTTTSSNEWADAIAKLAMDTDLRRQIGRNARQTAEEKYSLHIWGPKVAEIMDSL